MFSLFVQELPPSPDNVAAFAQKLFEAVMGGQWAIVVAMALVGIIWGARRVVGRWAFFKTDEGAFTVNLSSSFTLAIATTLFASGWAGVTGAVLLKALEVSFLAAGGWAALTKFLFPLLARIPALATVFGPKADGPALVVEAQKAGLEAAAATNPPTSDGIANGG